jgi:phosphoglycolate phosphatase-like HAD superfamily hydrolase
MERSGRLPPVIFDLDDTLIESFPTYARLHQRVAADLGWPVPSTEALVPYRRTWDETLAALWPGAEVAAFVRRYDDYVDAHPYPGIAGAQAALDALASAGHARFIVTKRTRRRLAIRMRQAGLEEGMFAGIFPAEDQPALKPDPACFAPVWRAFGRQDPRAVYVGDRHEDRQAAEAAGIRFVAVLTGPEVRTGFPGDLAAAQVVASVADVPRLEFLRET